ncbi:MAG: ACT domain-containing protein [Firmicutes bacterium]|nr:ACT domain-containing protein [Bacillota bacterium]
MKKAIITVLGQDRVGIISGVCTLLANENINILDISQTIVDGYFNMMMIVDVSGVDNLNDTIEHLDKIGSDLGVIIKCQREEIFASMHRI